MKHIKTFAGIAALALLFVMICSLTACDNATTSGGDDSVSYEYAIGDTGPGGGKIFYIDKADQFEWIYLEAAPQDISGIISWASKTGVDANADYSAIGEGKENTACIIAAYPTDTTANNAAKACAAYRGLNNLDDWFLPSSYEMAELYNTLIKNKTNHGFQETGSYWTSTELDWTNANLLRLDNGGFSASVKTNTALRYARPIRSFGGENTATATYTVSPDSTVNTTSLVFSFNRKVYNLRKESIIIAGGAGSVTKGSLSGNGKTWTLDVDVWTAGTITVSINKPGIESGSKTVTVYKEENDESFITYDVSPDSTVNTTSLNFTFDNPVDDLMEWEIIIINGKGEVEPHPGGLSGSGTSWSLRVTVVSAGDITVYIYKDGIDWGDKTVMVYKEAASTITYNVSPNNTTNTTSLDFTFSSAVTGLRADNIFVYNVTGAVAQKTISGSGTTWTLGVTVLTAGTITVSIYKDGIENGAKTVEVYKAGGVIEGNILTITNISGKDGMDAFVSIFEGSGSDLVFIAAGDSVIADGAMTFMLGTSEYMEIGWTGRGEYWIVLEIYEEVTDMDFLYIFSNGTTVDFNFMAPDFTSVPKYNFDEVEESIDLGKFMFCGTL